MFLEVFSSHVVCTRAKVLLVLDRAHRLHVSLEFSKVRFRFRDSRVVEVGELGTKVSPKNVSC